jgi:hypothetical protein
MMAIWRVQTDHNSLYQQRCTGNYSGTDQRTQGPDPYVYLAYHVIDNQCKASGGQRRQPRR